MRVANSRSRKVRSKWHLLRWGCLAWLVLSQFPLPMAHSHERLLEFDPGGFVGHLRCHHPEMLLVGTPSANEKACCEAHQPGDVHWHWLLPWELVVHPASDGMTPPVLTSLALGLSSGGSELSGVATQLSADTAHASRDSRDWTVHPEAGTSPAALLPNAAATTFWRPTLCMSFGQSYLGLPLRELVCVCLR